MRWIPFIILAYLLTLLQTTLGRLMVFHIDKLGLIGPDLLALAAVYVALQARSGMDVMLSGWLLGLGLDLTMGPGGSGNFVPGAMPVAYALAAGMVFGLREAFFRDRPLTQIFTGLLFCIVAHGMWILLQAALGFRGVRWAGLGHVLSQAAMLSMYTALLMPLGLYLLARCQRWLLVQPPASYRRGQR